MNHLSPSDPNANIVPKEYGGYDPNEKGITQYPKYTEWTTNPSDCSFQGPFPPRDKDSRGNVLLSDPILDPITTHYRRFLQDPGLKTVDRMSEEPKALEHYSSCCAKSKACGIGVDKPPRFRKPIDPVHWKPDLFDTDYEKYYLRNLINEDPYRNDFLSRYSEATCPLHYLTEYKERFSGNPTMETSSLGVVQGLSRPTDITECSDWRRNRTSKLRDVIFTHDKDALDSHLDYNDPKRYDPWGRHLAGHTLLVQPNYRPTRESRVQFKPVTVLPTVGTKAQMWIM